MPLIIPAVMAGVSAYSAYKQSKAQSAAQNQAQSAINTQSGLANTLADYSKSQYQLGKPALSTAIGMYTRLASGDRGAVQGAIAPDVARATEASQGVGKYLEQQGVRGGVRDTALAENRTKLAGTVGMMPFLARQNAIQNLGQLGSTTTSQGLTGMSGATGAAAGVTGAQLATGAQNFYQGEVLDQHIADFGTSLASMVIPYLNQQKGKGTGYGSFNSSAFGGWSPTSWAEGST